LTLRDDLPLSISIKDRRNYCSSLLSYLFFCSIRFYWIYSYSFLPNKLVLSFPILLCYSYILFISVLIRSFSSSNKMFFFFSAYRLDCISFRSSSSYCLIFCRLISGSDCFFSFSIYSLWTFCNYCRYIIIDFCVSDSWAGDLSFTDMAWSMTLSVRCFMRFFCSFWNSSFC
jgi:hypothetical protein